MKNRIIVLLITFIFIKSTFSSEHSSIYERFYYLLFNNIERNEGYINQYFHTDDKELKKRIINDFRKFYQKQELTKNLQRLKEIHYKTKPEKKYIYVSDIFSLFILLKKYRIKNISDIEKFKMQRKKINEAERKAHRIAHFYNLLTKYSEVE